VRDADVAIAELTGTFPDGRVIPFVEVYEVRAGRIAALRLYIDPGAASD
jgi:hypothetical protein